MRVNFCNFHTVLKSAVCLHFSGQIGMICTFQDALSEPLVKLLYNLGPNAGLAFPSEDSPEALDISNRLVFFFSARACLNNICPNLHPPHHYEGM